jgi:hypothetical protein
MRLCDFVTKCPPLQVRTGPFQMHLLPPMLPAVSQLPELHPEDSASLRSNKKQNNIPNHQSSRIAGRQPANLQSCEEALHTFAVYLVRQATHTAEFVLLLRVAYAAAALPARGTLHKRS